jgi:hypothetical protein
VAPKSGLATGSPGVGTVGVLNKSVNAAPTEPGSVPSKLPSGLFESRLPKALAIGFDPAVLVDGSLFEPEPDEPLVEPELPEPEVDPPVEPEPEAGSVVPEPVAPEPEVEPEPEEPDDPELDDPEPDDPEPEPEPDDPEPEPPPEVPLPEPPPVEPPEPDPEPPPVPPPVPPPEEPPPEPPPEPPLDGAGAAGTATETEADVTKRSLEIVVFPAESPNDALAARSSVLVPVWPAATEEVAVIVHRVGLVCEMLVIAEIPVKTKSTPEVDDTVAQSIGVSEFSKKLKVALVADVSTALKLTLGATLSTTTAELKAIEPLEPGVGNPSIAAVLDPV